MARFPGAAHAIAVAAAALSVVVFAAGNAQARATSGTSAAALAWITLEADSLSGRVLTVTCAADETEWAEAVRAAGLPDAGVDEYYGFSFISEGVMRLSPYVCQGLTLGAHASTRAANELQVAWAVDVLVHESTHMARFTVDESLTEACARAGLPVELHRLYGIAYHSAALSRLTAAAAQFRRTMGAAYQGGICSSPR